MLSGRLLFDPMISGFLPLADEPHALWAESALRVDLRPFSWIAGDAEGVYMKVPWGEGSRDGSELRAMVGLALLWDGQW